MKILELKDLEFFQKHTHREVVQLRNARIKRLEKEKDREDKRRREQEAQQRRDVKRRK